MSDVTAKFLRGGAGRERADAAEQEPGPGTAGEASTAVPAQDRGISAGGRDLPAEGRGISAGARGRRRLPSGGRERLEGVALPAVSILALAVLWEVLSLILGSRFVPSPAQTVGALGGLAQSGEVAGNLGITLVRVGGGFTAALGVGVLLGTAMGLFQRGERLLELVVMVALTVPSLCYIIVAFLWLGLTETATIFAIAITTFPVITVNVWSGVKSIDQRLVDMGQVFGAPPRVRAARIVLPQVLPYVIAAARYGFGIAWKVTVFVELIGRSSGVGYQLNYSFQQFQMPNVFAWTLLFTVVMLAIELLGFKPLESYLFRWRPAVRA